MKYVDEFRDAAAVNRMIDALRRRVTRRWTIMEVCGGQTHGLLRYGIDEALDGVVELIHGPGCPVCVTDAELVDRAIELARRPNVVVATFGDMLRVPGSSESLSIARAQGATVRAVYSPLDALGLAEQQPDKEFVFFAVGFETTGPATALAVRLASRRALRNFSLLMAHVRVQPAMEAILNAPDNRVQAFLAAGHVCTVVGYRSYRELAQNRATPIVVTGFEPVDLVKGIAACVEQLESGCYGVENCYGRSVGPQGNLHAARLANEVFEPCDRVWRGIGVMRSGGLRLRAEWKNYDAELRYPATAPLAVIPQSCRSGDVLCGRIKPTECAAFGKSCTPDSPLGAPMVSSEGACSAYFRYHGAALDINVKSTPAK